MNWPHSLLDNSKPCTIELFSSKPHPNGATVKLQAGWHPCVAGIGGRTEDGTARFWPWCYVAELTVEG